MKRLHVIKGVKELSLIEPGFDQSQLEINFELEMLGQAWFVYYYFELNSSLNDELLNP